MPNVGPHVKVWSALCSTVLLCLHIGVGFGERWSFASGAGRFVGGLSGLHTFFTSTNRTTYEHFRTRVNGQGNPYDVGFFRNWAQVHSLTSRHP